MDSQFMAIALEEARLAGGAIGVKRRGIPWLMPRWRRFVRQPRPWEAGIYPKLPCM